MTSVHARLQFVATILMILAALSVIAVTLPGAIERWTGEGSDSDSIPQATPEGAVLRGNPEASLVLIVFSDFECPACRRFARETMPVLLSKYVDTGGLLLAFRHLPLERIHPTAFNAAEAAECAGRQGHFWEMHDAIFDRSGPFDDDLVLGLARQLGLRTQEFAGCMQGEVTAKIHADLKIAASLRINGTPSFLLFQKQKDGVLRPLRRFSGAVSPQKMEAALQSTSDAVGR